MAEMLLRPLADAFMEVGVFIAALIAVFGWLRWRHGDRLLAVLRRPRWAPAVGAVLGVTPGCAGAILVMPLYARGTVSFGGVIAALVATMGDSSWVIMAADPQAALTIHGILLGTGLVTGYTVDALGIGPPLHRASDAGAPAPEQPARAATSRRPRRAVTGRTPSPSITLARAQRPAVIPSGTALAAPLCPAALVTVTFWLLAAVGLVVAVPTAFQFADPRALAAALGGIDPYLALGTAGTVAAAAVFAVGRGKLADDTLDTALSTGAGRPFAAVLRHGAHETSFVIVWVAAVYLAWTVLETTTGFDGSQLPVLGLAGVVVGALVGLIPGCAVQIVFTGLYVSGAVPFPTLIANALSQDGDALLPLIAVESKAALVATCITTVPGLLVGTVALLLL